MVNDWVYIKGLTVDATIGVYDWERTIKQRLVFDLEMCFDIKQAAATDDLQYALDYSAVSQRIIAMVEVSEFELLEALAEQVAGHIMEEFSLSGLRLKLAKPGAVPEAASVGLVIVRGDYPLGVSICG